MKVNKLVIFGGGKICKKRQIKNGDYLFKKLAKIKT